MKNTEELKDKATKILTDVKDDSKSFTKKDIEDGKVMALLSYILILVLIPFFVEKNNKFVIYHAKQGMNLLIVDFIMGIILYVVGIVLPGIIMTVLSTIVGLCALALAIMGIVYVLTDKAKELPIINKVKIIK